MILYLLGGALALFYFNGKKSAGVAPVAPVSDTTQSGSAAGLKPDNQGAEPPLRGSGDLKFPPQKPKSAGAVFGLLP